MSQNQGAFAEEAVVKSMVCEAFFVEITHIELSLGHIACESFFFFCLVDVNNVCFVDGCSDSVVC